MQEKTVTNISTNFVKPYYANIINTMLYGIMLSYNKI